MFYPNLVVIGLTVGAIYALYGLGITLIYKATRVPNFAHGAVGMLGAYVFFKTWGHARSELRIPWVRFQVPFSQWKWQFVPPRLPMWAALLIALLVTAALGLLIERVMRLLEGAPTVLLIVATLGILLVITGLVSDWFSPNSEIVPQVVPEGYHHVAGINFSNAAIVFALLSLGLALGFGVFFRSTNLGIAIRATADSREVARLLGINANAVAAFAWAVGSMLACIAGILITPQNQLDQATLFFFIVPGFAAALFGGFTSLLGTFLGGLFLGVIEQVLKGATWWPNGFVQQMFTKAGTPQFVSFLVIVAVLMLRPRFIFRGIRVDEDTGVAFAKRGGLLGPEDRIRRALDRANALPVILRDWGTGKYVLATMVGAGLLAVPMLAKSYWSTVLASGTVFALVALSIVVLTGWTGQINMAALTFAGAGAWGAALFAGTAHLPFWLAIPLSGLVGVPISLLIGIPALRLRGFFLAIATMAFALAGEAWLFTLPQLTTRNKVPRGILGEQATHATFLVSLLFAGLLFYACWRLSKTRVARAWYALRDSETTAVSMGIDPVRYKLLAFVAAGFIAGVGGGLFGYVNRILNAPSFSVFQSLNFVTFAVIAGIGEIFGAFLVGVFQITPALFARSTGGVNQAPFILSGLIAIQVAVQYPNGLAAFYRRLVRPFHPSERVAWASADEGAKAVTAGEATAADIARAARQVAEPDLPLAEVVEVPEGVGTGG